MGQRLALAADVLPEPVLVWLAALVASRCADATPGTAGPLDATDSGKARREAAMPRSHFRGCRQCRSRASRAALPL
jgi:hypothetical protein